MKVAEVLAHGRTSTEIKEDALFRHGYLTGNGVSTDDWTAAAIALADIFGQPVDGDIVRLDASTVRCAERNIGKNVPEPFYRGFPMSVRELSAGELLVDQLMHYLLTYGTGNFSGPSSHSLLENDTYRRVLGQNHDETDWRPAMAVVSREAGDALVESWVHDTLGSKRPAPAEEIALVVAVLDSNPAFEIEEIACRETLVYLADVVDDKRVYDMFRLRDVLAYAEWTARRDDLERYGEYMPAYSQRHNLKKLNMRNQDRKRVTALLDHVLERGLAVHEKFDCFERQADWTGLLHHIHYKSRCDNATAFVNAMRSIRKNKSHMSTFERILASGDVATAAEYLARKKGQGALLRNLDYLLSRTKTEAERTAVLDALSCTDITQLVQLMLHYAAPDGEAPRVFTWSKFETLYVHHETEAEAKKRRSRLDETTRTQLLEHARRLLSSACEGRIEYAYIDESLRGIAVPLNESTANVGANTLPNGSRIELEDGTVRVFTYWEKVDDVDLSIFGLTESRDVHEFSWRTMWDRQSDAITFSGDVTNGYYGGSEYFDLNLTAIERLYPEIRYVVCCDNVFSRKPFDKCDVRAGYMLRKDATAGEVFEPKTVRTSFAVTGNSTYAYLFAIDVKTREFIWLNVTKNSNGTVAGYGGARNFDFLERWLNITKVIDLYELAQMMTTTQVDNVCEADVAFVYDRSNVETDEDVEVITPADTERIRSLLH